LIQDSSGATPLHVAIAHHAAENVITALLEVEPSACKITDKRVMLPLHYAAALRYSPFAPIQAVVEANPSALTATTEDGDTPLHLLISNYPEKNWKRRSVHLDVNRSPVRKIGEELIGIISCNDTE